MFWSLGCLMLRLWLGVVDNCVIENEEEVGVLEGSQGGGSSVVGFD